MEDKEAGTTAAGNSGMEGRKVEYRRPLGKDRLQLPVGGREKKKSGGWSIGLVMGSTDRSVSGNSIGEGGLMQSNPSFGCSNEKVDLSIIANGIMDAPEGQALMPKNDVPYLVKNLERIVDIDHKQPLSFGFSVRKGLAKGFSVEVDLTYTYLASDARFVESPERVSRKLHYSGIPLRTDWDFIDEKSSIIYVFTGGAVEKYVYGKIGSESGTVKPLQFSVTGVVGVQYNISRRAGVYTEPGMSYFFDDGSDI